MTVGPSDSPSDPEDTAEKFCMKTLPPPDYDAFAEHVRRCDACARLLRDTEIYVAAMRAAAKEIRNREEPS